MRHPVRFPLLSVFMLCAVAAHAQVPVTGPAGPDGAGAGPLDRRSWAAEVRALRAAEARDLAPLARAAREAAPGSHAGAQLELEDAKRAWRRRALSAQFARVRTAGLAEHARVLEQRIAELDAVRDRRVPGAPAGGGR